MESRDEREASVKGRQTNGHLKLLCIWGMKFESGTFANFKHHSSGSPKGDAMQACLDGLGFPLYHSYP